MTDEKYKKYVVNKGFGVYYYTNLNDIFEFWKNNPFLTDYFFTYKKVDYLIQVDKKPYISYYSAPDLSDEHITYFDSFEEMFENYHLQDGALLLDYMINPKYADIDWWKMMELWSEPRRGHSK